MSIKSEPQNFHCTIIDIAGFGGLLIIGVSGSGKTSLALGLLEHFNRHDKNTAAFVCDDQALLSANNAKLIAHAPNAIEGKVEIFGFGISEIDHKPASEIKLIVELVEDALIERMPEDKIYTLMGLDIAHIQVPIRHEAQSIRIIKAWLNKNTPCD
ncbi:MAG: HPr kinase/phosphorylase [Nitratireductor sp.]